MNGEAVLLRTHDRVMVETACQDHCHIRGWHLHSVSARTNHVHLVVAANEKPQTVRDQLKANCTRSLRQQRDPLDVERTWSRGGDCQLLKNEADVEAAVLYVSEVQDRK